MPEEEVLPSSIIGPKGHYLVTMWQVLALSLTSPTLKKRPTLRDLVQMPSTLLGLLPKKPHSSSRKQKIKSLLGHPIIEK